MRPLAQVMCVCVCVCVCVVGVLCSAGAGVCSMYQLPRGQNETKLTEILYGEDTGTEEDGKRSVGKEEGHTHTKHTHRGNNTGAQTRGQHKQGANMHGNLQVPTSIDQGHPPRCILQHLGTADPRHRVP